MILWFDSNLIASWWCGARKKNSRAENIFDASTDHDARRQLITRIGGDSPLRLILFILCERNKKKSETTREKDRKRKYLTKKNEKKL